MKTDINLDDLKGVPVQQFYKMNKLEKATDEEKIFAFKKLGMYHTAHVKTIEERLKVYEFEYGEFTGTIKKNQPLSKNEFKE